MSENVHRVMEGSSEMTPVISQPSYDANVDYIISDYMERLGTRLNILETELKYAWRALDLLSQEYIKMWERLEKLEGLLYEQQNVISQLLDFYTSGQGCGARVASEGAVLDGRLGELEVIREILGNGTVEDGLEEGVDVTRSSQTAMIQELDLDMDEMNVPDEAFYRSLNQAYRDDLVNEPSRQSCQLGMIWEEREEGEETATTEKKDRSPEIYSAMDYKDYRGNSPCVSEQDIAQLTRISTIDQVAIEKLNELDRLSTKLQQDSMNIKQLQRKLLESPHEADANEELRKIYKDNDNWSFSSGVRDHDEMIRIGKSDIETISSFANRPSSRLSVSEDAEVAETLAGGMRTPTSPRRRPLEVTSCSAPFTTVTGRLAYSAAVQNAEAAQSMINSKNPFYTNNLELNSLIAASYETVPCSSPAVFSVKSEKPSSPTHSISSLRTRQDGYVQSPSPPPPAPKDTCDSLVPTQVFQSVPTTSINNHDYGRLSPKSPRTSPKRRKSPSSNIVAAKSDSGLSSMSGWSSLEKSPGSPKNGGNSSSKVQMLNFLHQQHNHTTIPHIQERTFTESDTDSFITNPLQVPVCNAILPGGHHLSAFTTVKSPCSLESSEGYGTFVPAPAPASDINVSPRKRSKHHPTTTTTVTFNDYVYRNHQPAIYSVAGSNRDSYTTVYTSNSADYVSQTMNYPDLIEPYENNELHSRQFLEQAPSDSRRPSRGYGVANHEGYKTAMYRTMFPSGNITDALSYYPTSTRYDTNIVQANYNEHWAGYAPEPNQYHENMATSTPTRMENQYQQRRVQPPNEQKQQQEQPIYENQQQIQEQYKNWNKRQEIPYLELDLRNRNVPEYVIQQQHGERYFDTSGVIVSQAGYLSISSDINETTREDKQQKKIKRTNTLKSAMNSVSHWLPDLHLSKRHRSYSLPSGARREDYGEGRSTNTSKPIPSSSASRKKKKNVLVSTVSGILQKAKRRSYHHTQSLSDPEQSENEWVLKRASSVMSEDDRSEDSCSVFSESQDVENMFAKVVPNKTKTRKKSEVHETELPKVERPPPEIIEQQHEQEEVDNAENYVGEEEVSGKSTGSGSSNIFPTVGDVKKNSAPSDKSDDSTTSESKNFPQMALGGASMEFAVSRALGKYRQRQTTISDEEPTDRDERADEEDMENQPKIETNEPDTEETPLIVEQKSLETEQRQASTEENQVSEGSPASSFRSHMGRFFPRHQQSLEIPGMGRDDDDNRSTHSWRSGSRVSSRRQSTEDSIDSEDEWYCYELRKLEEMEKYCQVEAEVGEPLVEEVEDSYEPCEEVKEKMSFVLRELRMKAKVVEGVLNEAENNRQILISVKARENKKVEPPTVGISKITDYQTWRDTQEEEPIVDELVSIKEVAEEDEEHSSGETSGPDSPHQSTDEYDENEMLIAEEFARCHVKNSEEEVGEVKQEEQQKVKQVTFPPESVTVPKITVEGEHREESSKEAGSKWKLLKALKERKAEEKEKINQEKVTETSTTEKDKVSMLGMMQKFYEIHVKT